MHEYEVGEDPELLRPVLGVQPEYLDAALHEMTTMFGDIEGYFAEGLGLDRDAQAQLRSVLINAD